VSSVPDATPLASWLSLSTLWIGEGVAGARSAGVWRVWVADFGHGGDDLSGYANPFTRVVSRHVVGDHPEERGQRIGATKSVGAETIQDRLDDAA